MNPATPPTAVPSNVINAGAKEVVIDALTKYNETAAIIEMPATSNNPTIAMDTTFHVHL
jgi:hypothetical protein